MKFIYICAALLVATEFSYCWNAPTHMVISQIAWNNMTPSTKQSVASLLSTPISYPGTQELSAKTSTIQTASLWAETLNESNWKSLVQKKFNKNLQILTIQTYISQSSSAGPIMRYYSTAYISSNGDNLAYGIESAEKVLSSSSGISNNTKAIALRYLISFVGNATQPFQVSNPFMNSQNTESARLIFLQVPLNIPGVLDVSGTQDQTLYALWNDAGGVFSFSSNSDAIENAKVLSQQIRTSAQDIEQMYSNNSKANYLVSLASVRDWAIETNKLAIQALQNNNKKIAYNFQNGASDNKIIMFNDERYTEFVQNMSKQQVYVAGMRLANVLNAIFDPNNANFTYTSYITRDVVANGNITNIYQF
ncbi:MAG: hypothetical protein NTX05_05145 [Fusobacteria bacterium]|nr:hypothetical protein [Fusobacteriota bacterium]